MSGALLTMDFARSSDGEGQVNRTIEHVTVAGRHVRVDVYGDAGCPTVLLLHGAGGLLADGGLMRRAGRMLALHGMRACVVRYFHVTSTLFATPANVREHGMEWVRAVGEVVRHYAGEDGVGLLGHALGGSLAVGAGFEMPEVVAVAVMNTGLVECQQDIVPLRVPPMLILHGADDTRVPAPRVEAMERLARQEGGFVDMVMYPREGHSFGPRTEADALRRVTGFFLARLGAGVPR